MHMPSGMYRQMYMPEELAIDPMLKVSADQRPEVLEGQEI